MGGFSFCAVRQAADDQLSRRLRLLPLWSQQNTLRRKLFADGTFTRSVFDEKPGRKTDEGAFTHGIRSVG